MGPSHQAANVVPQLPSDVALPPTIVFLFGPPAVGKMTVGQALERRTGLQLFHVHQVSDLVGAYFPSSTAPDSSYRRLVVSYRRRFFEEAARCGLSLISTGAWQFDEASEEAAIRSYVQPFMDCEGRAYLVELTASLEVRLARNRTENRHRHKNTAWSTDTFLREVSATHRYDSGGTIPLDVPFLRLETDALSPYAAAHRIVEYFRLPQVPSAILAPRP